MQNEIPIIAIIGGAGGGKSTGMPKFKVGLEKEGYRVITTEESATYVVNNSLHGAAEISKIARDNYPLYCELQRQILRRQVNEMRWAKEMAALFPDEKNIILLDRWLMDGAAFIKREDFEKLLDEEGITEAEARDCCDGVVHLVTSARGAEKYYELARKNNPARRESISEACESDRRLLQAWCGCPHLAIIDNSTDFDTKIKRAFEAILRFVGVPEPMEIERSFLIEKPDFNYLLSEAGARKFFIEQVYIDKSGKKTRVRKRTQCDRKSSMCWETEKIKISSGVNREPERIISQEEFDSLKILREDGTTPIVKNRYYVIWKDQYFELDAISRQGRENIEEPIYKLEIELGQIDDPVEFPPFIKIIREVTDDSRYSNYGIAKGLHLKK